MPSSDTENSSTAEDHTNGSSDPTTDSKGSGAETPTSPADKDGDTDLEKLLKSRLRFRDAREDKNGIETETEAGPFTDESLKEQTKESKDDEKKAAEVVRHYEDDGTYSYTVITILSSNLNNLLLSALRQDPRINHGRTSNMQRFFSPYEPVIHHWESLEKLTNADAVHNALFSNTEDRNSLEEEAIATDLQMFLKVVQDTPEVRPYFRTERELQEREQSVTFEMLWTLFPPDTILYTTNQFKRPQCYIVKQADEGISKRYKTPSPKDYWLLKCSYIDWDGSKYVQMAARCKFMRFEKSLPITKLPAYPLSYFGKREDLEKKLFERGQKFARLCKDDFRLSNYEGLGILRGEVFEKTTPKSSKSLMDWLDESSSGKTSEDTIKAPRSSMVSTILYHCSTSWLRLILVDSWAGGRRLCPFSRVCDTKR